MIYYSVLEAFGVSIKLNNIKILDEVEFKRYWGGIGIYAQITLGRI